MTAPIISKTLKKASQREIDAGKKESLNWLRLQMSKVTENQTHYRNFTRDEERMRQQFKIGRMYFFRYDPKTKEQLPYYDTFPLIFLVGPAEGGFYGINLHYLPPLLRAKLMDQLLGIQIESKNSENTRLLLSYNILNSASRYHLFKPTLKRYLTSHMKSKFIWVPPEEWLVASMLPAQRFKKSSESKVWNDSRRMVS